MNKVMIQTEYKGEWFEIWETEETNIELIEKEFSDREDVKKDYNESYAAKLI